MIEQRSSATESEIFDYLAQMRSRRAEMERFKEELLARHMEARRMGMRLNIRTALEMRSGLATPESLDRLWTRNDSLYRAPEIADAILCACDGSPTALTALRTELAEHGALVERQNKQVFAERLANPRWIIGEASAKLPERPLERGGADCQCLVPEDRADAQWVMPLLRPGVDTIYEEDIYAEIMEAGPAASALIDQIAVDRAFAHSGMAAQARYKAFSTVRDLEREHPIDHLIGLAFCIQGMELSGGRRFMLKDFGETSISNIISLLINQQSKRCPATVVGRLRGQKTPVEFECQGRKLSGSLLIDWYWLDHRTEHIR